MYTTARRAAGAMFLALAVTALNAAGALADAGKPRNIEASPDGLTLVATSLATSNITQFTVSPFSGAVTHTEIAVGAPSWDVCFLDANLAVLSHPDLDEMTVLQRSGGSGLFAVGTPIAVPYGCTEILRDHTDPGHVYVACKGVAPGAESWRNSVVRIDCVNRLVEAVFETEREPRGLALSPDGERLFVGHVQGALGQEGLAADHALADKSYDGGSLLVFDTSAPSAPLLRFALGSPIRGLAVFPPPGTPSNAIPPNFPAGQYRVYFSYLGEGAQSEDPQFGGRTIANVIGNIGFDASNQPLGTDPNDENYRQNVVFNHEPDNDFPNPVRWTTNRDALPAVLPERFAFRYAFAGGLVKWELWTTFSASGTVGRADVDGSGKLITEALPGGDASTLSDFDVLDPTLRGNRDALGQDPTISNANTIAASGANSSVMNGGVVNYRQAHKPALVCLGDLLSTTSYQGNPRGIVWTRQRDANAPDALWIVNQLDHEALRLRGLTKLTSLALDRYGLSASDPNLPEEQAFFTFGEAFDFREGSTARVNNVSCGSCHVDAHLDGKVRLTVSLFALAQNPIPVAVPSIFDVGSTEWLFFDGSRTILDDDDLNNDGVDDGKCTYCAGNRFFRDTKSFTFAADSPQSPHDPAPAPAIDAKLGTVAQQRGRGWFEQMNCVRCHSGPTTTYFERFNAEFDQSLNQLFDQDLEIGPLTRSLKDDDRYFHDATQSFITLIGDVSNSASLRNGCNVGSRIPPVNPLLQGPTFEAVNTPALAGAWDNAPYFHDGRYRTLDQVLEHTWLQESLTDLAGTSYKADNLYLAAPYHDPSEILPDNAYNQFSLQDASVPAPINTPLFNFGTHSHEFPQGMDTSVASWLDTQSGTAKGDLLAFMNALSSRTDPCADLAAPLTISGPTFLVLPSGDTGITWTTNVPVSCRVSWNRVNQAEEPVEFTAVGTTHSVMLPTHVDYDYEARVSAQVKMCGEEDSALFTWTATPGGAPLSGGGETGILAIGPNPFNPLTQIDFALAEGAMVRAQVYDILGRRVASLQDGYLAAGSHSLQWDGENEGGTDVASGVYFLAFSAGEHTEKHRLVLLK